VAEQFNGDTLGVLSVNTFREHIMNFYLRTPLESKNNPWGVICEHLGRAHYEVLFVNTLEEHI
jgi:hypothetical protein